MIDYIKHLREKIGSDIILIPSVAAIIVNENGEVLLQERAKENTWGTPGGLMDLGETVLECLSREVFEETNLVIENPTLFGIYSGPRYKGKYPNGDEIQVVPIVFLANTFSGELKSDEESLSLKFFHPSNFPIPLGKHHEEYLLQYKEYIEGKRRLPIIL